MNGPVSLLAILPEVTLLVASCVVLLVAQLRDVGARRAIPGVSLMAFVVALLLLRLPTVFGMTDSADALIRSGVSFGDLAEYVRIGAVLVGGLVVLVAWSQGLGEERGEFFAMILMSVSGLMLVGSAADLIVLFMALELVSIPTYALVSLSRLNPRGLEAGTKYFYLGALAAAVTAFGFSYLYGVGGGAVLSEDAARSIAEALQRPGTLAYGLATVGVVLSIGGLLFKLAAVPLHFYIADVYQGASSPVAGMLGFVPKLAGVVAIFKVLELTGWQTGDGPLFWMLWLVAALSMTVGNVLALRQTSVKRMLAFSGVAHSGYMLVGMLAGPFAGEGVLGDGAAAVLYYVIVYGIANLGAFALIDLLRVNGRPAENLRDLAGLLRRSPGPALLMTLSMFTLMGLPPTAGFWGKVALFGSALYAGQESGPQQTWFTVLVVIAVLNTAVGAAYYLRVIASVLLYENDEPAEPAPREMQFVGAVLCGLLTLFYAILPGFLLEPSRIASQTFRMSQRPAAVQPLARAPPAPPTADRSTETE